MPNDIGISRSRNWLPGALYDIQPRSLEADWRSSGTFESLIRRRMDGPVFPGLEIAGHQRLVMLNQINRMRKVQQLLKRQIRQRLTNSFAFVQHQIRDAAGIVDLSHRRHFNRE
ncbi:hypothetical protein A6X20_16890 [Bradyrhizobium elkanii]|nr:hypothetical protein A6X20_16890 [Bradyrhizobium elkanii]